MSCDEIRPQLTAYLDGELADDRGSIVRGHLRSCAACRDAANDEAAIRDGLRELPTLDPPASLWSGVQARLAEIEVADAERPRWRRVLAHVAHAPERALRGLRWLVVPRSAGSRLALGALVASTAIVLAYWRTHSELDGQTLAEAVKKNADDARFGLEHIPPPHVAPTPRTYDDVTDDLAADNGRDTALYNEAIDENEGYAKEARSHWAADRQHAFDVQVAKLRSAIAAAKPGPARHHAQSDLADYLRNAAIRGDEVVAVAGGMP